MMVIISLFILVSILASVVVVAACVKSSRLTQWENVPEAYDETNARNEDADFSPTGKTMADGLT